MIFSPKPFLIISYDQSILKLILSDLGKYVHDQIISHLKEDFS